MSLLSDKVIRRRLQQEGAVSSEGEHCELARGFRWHAVFAGTWSLLKRSCGYRGGAADLTASRLRDARSSKSTFMGETLSRSLSIPKMCRTRSTQEACVLPSASGSGDENSSPNGQGVGGGQSTSTPTPTSCTIGDGQNCGALFQNPLAPIVKGGRGSAGTFGKVLHTFVHH